MNSRMTSTNDDTLFNHLADELRETGWVTAGYAEDGKLIQFNTKTQRIRILESWVEITKVNND